MRALLLVALGLVVAGCPSETRRANSSDSDEQLGDVQAGDVLAGDVAAGQVAAGLVQAGDVLAGDVAAGQVVAGDVAAGQVVAGDVVVASFAPAVQVDVAPTVGAPMGMGDAAALVLVDLGEVAAVADAWLLAQGQLCADAVVQSWQALPGSLNGTVRVLVWVECP